MDGPPAIRNSTQLGNCSEEIGKYLHIRSQGPRALTVIASLCSERALIPLTRTKRASLLRPPPSFLWAEVERGCRHRRLQSLMHMVLEYARNALGFQDAQYAVIPTRPDVSFMNWLYRLPAEQWNFASSQAQGFLAAIDQRRR